MDAVDSASEAAWSENLAPGFSVLVSQRKLSAIAGSDYCDGRSKMAACGINQEELPLPTGKVKWFNITKGFGFIIPDEGGPEVYLPQRKVDEANLPRLETGMALQYSVGEDRGRTFAENLSVIETTKPASARQPVLRKTVACTVDPIDEFEKEWGLRRQ